MPPCAGYPRTWTAHTRTVDGLVEDRRKRVQDGTVMARPAVQTSSDAPSDLIERGHEMSVLGKSVEGVRSSSRGRLVFVAGEAGVGKTALLTRFCEDRAGGARVLWGACDALFTPRPLGPFSRHSRQLRRRPGAGGRLRGGNLRARRCADGRASEAVADDSRISPTARPGSTALAPASATTCTTASSERARRSPSSARTPSTARRARSCASATSRSCGPRTAAPA